MKDETTRRTEEIRARWERATRGPWTLDEGSLFVFGPDCHHVGDTAVGAEGLLEDIVAAFGIGEVCHSTYEENAEAGHRSDLAVASVLERIKKFLGRSSVCEVRGWGAESRGHVPAGTQAANGTAIAAAPDDIAFLLAENARQAERIRRLGLALRWVTTSIPGAYHGTPMTKRAYRVVAGAETAEDMAVIESDLR